MDSHLVWEIISPLNAIPIMWHSAFQGALLLTVKIAACTEQCFSQQPSEKSSHRIARDLPTSRLFPLRVFPLQFPRRHSILPSHSFLRYTYSTPHPPQRLLLPLVHHFHITLPFLIPLSVPHLSFFASLCHVAHSWGQHSDDPATITMQYEWTKHNQHKEAWMEESHV